MMNLKTLQWWNTYGLMVQENNSDLRLKSNIKKSIALMIVHGGHMMGHQLNKLQLKIVKFTLSHVLYLKTLSERNTTKWFFVKPTLLISKLLQDITSELVSIKL